MGAKDWLIQKAAVAMLNQSIFQPYGSVKDLKLDTTARSIDAEVELKGETQPLRLQVHEYEIIEADGTAYFVVKSVSTSREWLTTLAKNYVLGRRFEIPETARVYLPMIK